MNKIYRIALRVGIFFLLYLPLFAISFYSRIDVLPVILVFVSFYLSSPITKWIVVKFFPQLKE